MTFGSVWRGSLRSTASSVAGFSFAAQPAALAMDVSFTCVAKNSPRECCDHYSDAAGRVVVTRLRPEVSPKSCAALLNMFLSPDALGLLVDLFRSRRPVALARAAEAEKVDGAAANRQERAALALRFNDHLPVAGGRCGRLAGAGSRTKSRRVGFGNPWSLADPLSGNCRRRDFGQFAMVQSAASWPNAREGPSFHEGTGRADVAPVPTRAASLPGIGSHGRCL